MPKAKAPSRATFKGTLAFGLVSVPIQFLKATEDVSVKRSWFTADGHPVGNVQVDKETGEVIQRSDIVSKYVCEDGTLVDLSDDEIEAAAAVGPTGSLDLVGFYPLSAMAQYVPGDRYQVRPQVVSAGKGKKPGRPYDKPFALLMTALKDKGVFALVRYTSGGKTKIGALTGDALLHSLHFDAEVRQDALLPEVELSEQERAMAGVLIDAMLSDSPPVELIDEAADRVRAYAEAKAAAGGAEVPIPQPKEDTGVTDLMAALAASVEAAKVPA